MTTTQRETQRKNALSAAKEAVRSYSRNPSESNADLVREAWLRVRRSAADPRHLGQMRKVLDEAGIH